MEYNWTFFNTQIKAIRMDINDFFHFVKELTEKDYENAMKIFEDYENRYKKAKSARKKPLL